MKEKAGIRIHIVILAIVIVLPACTLSPPASPTTAVTLVLPTIHAGGTDKSVPADTSTVSAQAIGTTEVSNPPTQAFTPVVEVTPETVASPAGAKPEISSSPQGKIVFVCQIFRDDDRDQICLINADGSGLRRMTNNDRADYNYASLSPDGNSFIYAGKEGPHFQIYEMDLNQRVRQITNDSIDSYAPEISPDGGWIVLARKVDDHSTIWVMRRDGGEPRQIFGPPDGDAWDPVWSPDGQQVLFASNRRNGTQLYIVKRDGSQLRKVTEMNGLRGRSDWSPDGSTIATYAGASWQREIVLMDLDGSNLRPVTNNGNNLAPSFSPDGGWIAFTSYRDRYRDDNGCEIYIMRTDGSQITRLTDNTYCDWQPRWGP